MLTAKSDGRVLGGAVVLFHKKRAHARLYSIAVAADARGRGVGAALLAAAEREARTRGRNAIALEVRVDNASARALYEAKGYRQTAEKPAYYEDGASAARYEKPLAP